MRMTAETPKHGGLTTKSLWTEDIFSVLVASFDISPLSVVELTVLAGANSQFHAMQWPRCSMLWRTGCMLKWKKNWETVSSKLEHLGERLRSPHVAARAAIVGCADRFRAWAEEDRCRAAWAVAAVLSSVKWVDLENRGYIVRLLASGLVATAPWGSMSTASAVLEMVSRERGYSDEVDGLLREVGVGDLLARLVQHPSTSVQRCALEAISHACDLGCDPLELSGTDAVPAVISIAQSGCYDSKLAALEAIHWLAESSADRLKAAIPVLVQLLGHTSDDLKEAAASALWALMMSRQETYPIEACEHGCVPKLIDLLRRDKCQRQTILFCLERVTMPPAIRHMALQAGVLPLLFRSLQDERDKILQECILGMLLSYSSHVSQALVQQDAAERKSNIRQLVAISRAGSSENCTCARQLLEHITQDSSLTQ